MFCVHSVPVSRTGFDYCHWDAISKAIDKPTYTTTASLDGWSNCRNLCLYIRCSLCGTPSCGHITHRSSVCLSVSLSVYSDSGPVKQNIKWSSKVQIFICPAQCMDWAENESIACYCVRVSACPVFCRMTFTVTVLALSILIRFAPNFEYSSANIQCHK